VIQVELSNRQSNLDVDSKRLVEAARSVLVAENVQQATISLAVVDDETIHGLNRRFLSHDYPTDVLSFLSNDEVDHLEGEIIVSADTAVRSAVEYQWPAMHELMLYVIHGTLHLTGYNDRTLEERRKMRELESLHLTQLGITPPRDHVFVEQQPGETHSAEAIGSRGGADTS